MSQALRNIADVTATEHLELRSEREWADGLARTEGPQLVLAGPGTGKTEFLAQRVVRLIENGVAASAILVLTFSRRAAAELEARIKALLPRPVSGATASTFHSYAHRLVETHRHHIGADMPVLMTGPEQVRFVEGLLASEEPDHWPVNFRPILTTSTFAAEVADFVMRCHERLITPSTLDLLADDRADWRGLPGFLRRYRAELSVRHRIDYGALISEAAELARSGALAAQFTHVVVDEYQDTSPAQAGLAEVTAGADANLTVAADPHQSIYSFRGAEAENVARFTRRMSAAGHDPLAIVLGRSFRVPAGILDSARRLVEPNILTSLPKVEVAPAPHVGSVEAYTFDQRSAEAEWIAGEVERLTVSERLPLGSIAVLVRSTRHLLPELSRALDRRGIPHDRPNSRLVDHPAIRIVADMVRAATSPASSPEAELAVRRLLLGPCVSLSLGRERQLARAAGRRQSSWTEIIQEEIPEATGLSDLLSTSEWATEVPAVDGFWHVWDRMPGLEEIVADPDRSDYRAAWAEFAQMLARQSERDPTVTLTQALDAALTGEFEASPPLRFLPDETERLAVTTLHQAKGLEFDVVFISDAIEGVFPDARRNRALLQPQLLDSRLTTDAAAQARARLEEERRLAYTATTRARRRVIWTATTAGIDEGERRPSRFMLAATGLASFEDVGPPPTGKQDGFQPLTITEAQSRLRRLLVDPAAPATTRLGALSTLATASHWDPLTFAGVRQPGPDTGLMTGPIRLSPSQATLYDQCPRRYALERRLRAVNNDSPYLRFGSIVHEVLERAEKAAMKDGRSHSDLPTSLRFLAEVWEHYPPFGPPPLDEAWRRRAEALFEEMYGHWPGGDDVPVALEVDLDTAIGGVEWVGRADRVDRIGSGLKVVDYKTSKTPPTLKDAGGSLQLGYYVLAAANHPSLTRHGSPVAAELWYPLARSRRKVYPFDMERLDEVRDALAAVAAGVSREDWAPKVGNHCDRCDFRSVCPAWPEGREAHR